MRDRRPLSKDLQRHQSHLDRRTPATPPKRTRRPDACVPRAVWQRDQGRCTYVDARGQRCRETSRLEYHHEQAWALDGATTLDNLALRCTAHNALAAEQDFERELIQRKRRGDPEPVVND